MSNKTQLQANNATISNFINEVLELPAAPAQEEKTVVAGTTDKTIYPSGDNYLINKVTVSPTPSQTKAVTPGISAQTVNPDEGKLLSSVEVEAMPLGVLGLSLNNTNGVVTASVSSSDTVTGYGGYVNPIPAIANKTLQLTTKSAQTYYPTTSDQTIPSGRYTTGVQTIKGDTNFLEENIKKGVSMFGKVGQYMSEGNYIWKKYSVSPEVTTTNPQITLNIVASSGIATITSANFDTDYLDDGWNDRMINFFDGFTSSGTNVTKFAIVSGELYLYFGGTTNRQINNFVKSELKFRYTTGLTYSYTETLTYSGTKVLKPTSYEYVDMVISDNPDEFPDGNIQDGYYYEKVTLIASGEVTSTGTGYISIPHNLGKVPDFIMIVATSVAPGSWYSSNTYGGIYLNSGTASSYVFVFGNSSSAYKTKGTTYQSTTQLYIDEEKASLPSMSSTSDTWRNGATFGYIVGCFE